MRRHFEAREEGASLVESALTLSIAFYIIFSVFVAGLALHTYNYLSFAARAGSRYAMVRGSKCDNSNAMPNCPNVTSTEIQTYVRSLRVGLLQPSSLTVTATWPDGNNNPGSRVNITVTYPFNIFIPFVSGGTLTMHSTSQAVISQ